MLGDYILVQQHTIGKHQHNAAGKPGPVPPLCQPRLLFGHIPAEHQEDGSKEDTISGIIKELEQQIIKFFSHRQPSRYAIVVIPEYPNQVQGRGHRQPFVIIKLFHQPLDNRQSQHSRREMPQMIYRPIKYKTPQ